MARQSKHLLWRHKQTRRSARPHVHMDLMSDIIFLLSSIREKMNVNEMENRGCVYVGVGGGTVWKTRDGSAVLGKDSNWPSAHEG